MRSASPRMEASLIDDAPAGATGPVHNTTLVDGEDCRLKDTYGKFLISGYIVGIRDYLAGPRLEGFARGADETGHTLLATSDRATLIDAVQDVRHKLSLEPADAHALRMVTAMLCANPPVCTVHGALLALVLDRWGLDEKDVMQEIIFHLQHVPAQRAPIRQVVELCLQPISGEQLEVLLAETLQSQFPISFIDRDQLTNFASSSTYGSDALLPILPPHSHLTVAPHLGKIATCVLRQTLPPFLPWLIQRLVGHPPEQLLRNPPRLRARMALAHLTHPTGSRRNLAADRRLATMETRVPSQPSYLPLVRCLLAPSADSIFHLPHHNSSAVPPLRRRLARFTLAGQRRHPPPRPQLRWMRAALGLAP